MATIVLRSGKGSPLTIAEADANINNLNNEVGTKLASATYTPADILTKIKTVHGTGSGLDADLLDGLHASTTHVSSPPTATVVARDTSGNFSATTITANLTGNVTGNVIGDLTGNVTGNATNVSGVVSINNGGTGASTQSTSRTNLGLGTMATQNASTVAITGGSINGITDIAIADGGTGASSASQARTNLGLVLGSDVQAFSTSLTALSTVSTTGFYVRDSGGTAVTRLIAGGVNINVANGDGVSGNPTITLSSTPEVSAILKTGGNGVGDIGFTLNRFATIFGTSTSAKYADLAEKYTTDREYETGTVITVSLDTTAEGTASFEYAQRVLGVVSAKPAFIMNDDLDGQALALRGRVPVKVTGAIRKGQPLVANQDGTGIAGDHQNTFAIALETNLDPNVKLVECVIL